MMRSFWRLCYACGCQSVRVMLDSWRSSMVDGNAGVRGQPLLLANTGGADGAGDPAHLQVRNECPMLHLPVSLLSTPVT